MNYTSEVECRHLQARIKELEADSKEALNQLDHIAAALGMQDTDDDMAEEIVSIIGRMRRGEVERDAIEAATIERCEAALDECEAWDEDGKDVIWKDDAAARIRALAKPPESGVAAIEEWSDGSCM